LASTHHSKRTDTRGKCVKIEALTDVPRLPEYRPLAALQIRCKKNLRKGPLMATDQRAESREQVSNAITEAGARLQDARQMLAAAGLQDARIALRLMQARDAVAELADTVKELSRG
jgi:hypothetical protein